MQPSFPLIERDDHLATLVELIAAARAGSGQMVFLEASAGGGKTTLARTLMQHPAVTGMRTAHVSCDRVNLPGPLGGIVEIGDSLGFDLSSALAGDIPRDDIFRSILLGLRDAPAPVLLLGEDAHWTDEASVDLLRYLARRILALPVLVLVTFRHDDLDPRHPLRRLLGDLANAPQVTRLHLPPLSSAGVAQLAAHVGKQPGDLHDRTGGNPFLVCSLLASSDDALPSSIRDAVLGQAARLTPGGRCLVDALAVLGSGADPDLLGAITGGDVIDEIETGVAVGLMVADDQRIAFRHAIVREVLAADLSPPRRRDLHRRILAILQADGRFAGDDAMLAHHAELARDDVAATRYALAAARQAARFGAHREAVAQYARALRTGAGMGIETRAEVLVARAFECYLAGDLPAAIQDASEAAAIWHQQGNALRYGDTLRCISRYLWFNGDQAGAERYASQALAVLEPLPAGPELAMAWSNLSQLRMLDHEIEAAREWGQRALAIAEPLGRDDICANALINIGTAELIVSHPEARNHLTAGVARAIAADLPVECVRAWVNKGWVWFEMADLAASASALDHALMLALEHEIAGMEFYIRAGQGRILAARGDWDAAHRVLTAVLDRPSTTVLAELASLTALGLLAVRRGDDVGDQLDRALEMARQTGNLMRLGPVHLARAEQCWLSGDTAGVVEEASALFERALRSGERWMSGAMALWLHRAGEPIATDLPIAEPFAFEIAGDGLGAAALWHERGFPIEQARALASTGEPEHLLEALSIVDRLGARPDRARIQRQLRASGVATVPRGPRPQTLANPAGLTGREVEVLHLLMAGHTNREIGDRLFMSPRTVGHHVSAILGKLGVSSRREIPADLDALMEARS